MNTNKKNEQLKSCLTQAGSLVLELADGQNEISNDNKQRLINLGRGIDGLVRDGWRLKQKEQPPETSAAAVEGWEVSVKKRRVSYSQKQTQLEKLSDQVGKLQSNRSKKSGIKNQPTDLQHYRSIFFRPQHHKIEHDLYVEIHNRMIDVKLELRDESKKKGEKVRFAQTKSSSKVGSYDELKRKYKPKSLSAMLLRYRKLVFDALQINSIGSYKGEAWANFILLHQNVDQIISGTDYPELKEGLREQILLGKERSTTIGRRQVATSGGLNDFMVSL